MEKNMDHTQYYMHAQCRRNI